MNIEKPKHKDYILKNGVARCSCDIKDMSDWCSAILWCNVDERYENMVGACELLLIQLKIPQDKCNKTLLFFLQFWTFQDFERNCSCFAWNQRWKHHLGLILKFYCHCFACCCCDPSSWNQRYKHHHLLLILKIQSSCCCWCCCGDPNPSNQWYNHHLQLTTASPLMLLRRRWTKITIWMIECELIKKQTDQRIWTISQTRDSISYLTLVFT